MTPEKILEAVEQFFNTMELISSKRKQLAHEEIEAWAELRDKLEWYEIPWH
jgi:hypothetical protein